MTSSIEKIFEHVKRHPVLYDSSHPDYKNMRLKDKVWDGIAEEMQEEAEVLKKKWKNLRDCYAKHIRTQKTKAGEKCKTIDRYKTWRWAKQMEVFKPYLQFSQTASNVSTIDTQPDSAGDSGDESHPFMDTGPDMISDAVTQPVPSTSRPQESFNIEEAVEEAQTRKRKLPPREKEIRLSASVDKIISYLKNKSSNHSVDSYDPTELIFLAYARTIQRFSPKRQAIVKMKFAKIMMEEELLQQQEDRASSVGRPVSSSSFALFNCASDPSIPDEPETNISAEVTFTGNSFCSNMVRKFPT